MGGGSWSASSWVAQSVTVKGQSANQTYKSQDVKDEFKVKSDKVNEFGSYSVVRESCDSVEHPNSTPIIIGLDVTGSMSRILQSMAEKIGVVMNEVYARNPVSDPQIMFSAVGDGVCDRVPLQVTQFESDNRLVEQMKDIYFEKCGGGNGFESYPLVWHFAGNYTKCDNYIKRNKKGFIFTFGDDGYPTKITPSEFKNIFGEDCNEAIATEDILNQASRQYEIYHFCLEQGNTHRDSDYRKWQELLGENAILVSDYEKIPELIVSILELHSGKNIDDVAKTWDGSTAMVIKKSLGKLAINSSTELIEM